jgi:hypothetical protein
VTPEHILEIGFAFRKSKALLTAVELGLFAALADGPRTAGALVRRLRMHGRGARDFFDALVALKLLDRDELGRYANAPDCSVYLDPRRPTYLGGALEYLNSRIYPAWGFLTHALRQGTPQCGPSAAGGFESFYADQATFEIFLSGMTGGSRNPARLLAKNFPWARYDTLIDIGTAQGCVPVEIAHAHPHLRGGGFDLPLLEGAFMNYVRERGLDERLKFYPGNFFQDPLPEADVLIMGRILHDWDIPTRLQLLKKSFDALPAAGALIVHETFIDEARRSPAHSLLASLNMLIQTDGGSEFTISECKGWMRKVGFAEMRVIPLGASQTAVVATKTRTRRRSMRRRTQETR